MQYGVIVDLRAIQDYIFSSNRLKDNIGASYLVKHFFDGFNTGEGFCGGGNLFRLCRDEHEAKQIIRDLSIRIYEKCPGLSFSATYISDFDTEAFQDSMDKLQKKLREEKNRRQQQSTLPSYGINAQCGSSPYSAEFVCKTPPDEGDLLSRQVYAKRQAATSAVQEAQKLYQNELGTEFILPESFEDLGQDKGHESFIAVIHIDGNQIGDLFLNQASFAACKNLSAEINSACELAFAKMLSMAVKEISSGKWQHYGKRLKKAGRQKYLPIRPLFIGGDDITFISEGRLGLSLAIEFMNQFSQIMKHHDVSSSAGVALAKTNYPFYQVHKLANSLCRSAKNKRLAAKSKSDHLDFHIISSSVNQDLVDIRKDNYQLGDGRRLYQRPYSIADLQVLVNNAESLHRKWPNSKIKDLRSVLYQSAEQCDAFEAQRKSREDLALPVKGMDAFKDSLFVNGETIFLDMIEIIEMLALEDSQ
ncbi:MAG: hypothetical protein RBR69_09885 [Candidatus Cloacimonadaceae bacterium]|jgi:hypothetical protein|nr:hypothetical protein [Candidatus Cloacimonadota bacterium]MDY0128428.1 hypothetical protein [Candidatus Cloacimonadaceae bacterium]MCB5255859.1 hypothetical protein [Candidatus Cloacimonadota bacterium]MCK9242071.1 hypothetical protein [Candidatus Cloacimonadota bacterium]MDD3102730.1 hypothetical protein [Candidatus Cloacimonadota bacterium]